VFTDLHEAYLCYFLELLQEWILRLKDTHPTNRIRLVEWTTENIARLERVNNKFTHVVDFSLDGIVVGFITEFVVDTCKVIHCCREGVFEGTKRMIHSIILHVD
jgi:hypothetical protein